MVDLIILIIMILFIAIGAQRGLIRTLITLGSSIAALILSLIVYPMINAILKLTALYTIIYTGVLDKVKGIDFGRGIQSQGNAITENITWLPSFLTEQIKNNNNTAMYEILGVHTIQEYISAYVTNMIISMIAILVTWFLIKIVLIGTLGIMGSIVEHLPIISSFNKMGGAIVGLIKGLLTLSIIALVIPTLITIPSLNQLGDVMQTSFLARYLYNHNLVIWLYNYFI